MNADLQSSAPDFVVTLVHGTILGRHAGPPSWIEERSFFRAQLRSRLNGTVKFVPFRWSGANSHVERDRAARKLSAELKKNRKLNPNSKHFVIGHSHGGNVAISALQNAECEMSAPGVVCLATPFLRARPRKIDSTLRLSSLALWGLCSLCGFFFVLKAASVTSRVVYIPLHTTALTVSSIAFLAAWQVATWMPYVILRRRALVPVIERFRSIQANVLSNNDHHGAVDTPLFCAAPHIDEPFVWLSGVRAVATVPFWAWSPKSYLIYVIAIGIITVVSICLAADKIPWFVWLLALAVITAMFSGMYAFGYFVSSVSMVVSKIVRAHRIGFGHESFIDHLLFDVYVDQSPRFAKATVRYYAVSHCTIYENAAVVRDVADWMANIGLATSYDRREADDPVSGKT